MAFNKFRFEPEEGFLNSSFYENTPSDSREILQRQHNQTRDYINDVIDKIKSTREGESGSEHIGSPKIDGLSGENVFSQIKDMKRQLEYASAGHLSDSSVKENMLSKECVTYEKVAPQAIDTMHFKKDAVCPVSDDTKNINNIPSSLYQPYTVSGNWGVFKERASDTKLSNVYGKIRGKTRYFYENNSKVMKLDLESGEVSEFLDLSAYSTRIKITFDENGVLYFAFLNITDPYLYINVYKYENNEIIFVNKINAGYYPMWTFYLNDIEIYNGELFLGYCESGHYPAVYLYRIPLDKITEITEIAPFLSKRVIEGDVLRRILFINGDLCFYHFRLKNCSENEVVEYPWIFLDNDGGKILVEHSQYILIDENFLPCHAVNYKLEDGRYYATGFIYQGYFYMIAGEYLFRSRLY